MNIKLADVIDTAINKCPIDARRKLYGNIVLSGGNTMFKDFSRRLQRDVKRRVDHRLQSKRNDAGVDGNGSNESSLKKTSSTSTPNDFNVKVVENNAQNYSAWLGGSIVASTEQFYQVCHTKAQYEEEGARIARGNVMFKAQL